MTDRSPSPTAPCPVGIVQTGTSNLASVLAGLRRAGATPTRVETPAQMASMPRILLPGVGAFGAAIERLREAGMLDALTQRLHDGKPTLGICLGLQLLAAASDESPGVQGFGLIDTTIAQFQAPLRVPQFGWSQITPDPGSDFVAPGYAYFANAYKLDPAAARAAGWEVATAEYGGPYVAAMRKGALMACQFHPELSGKWGHALLTRWCQDEEGVA